MGDKAQLPFMPNREELRRFMEDQIDPDAERFRYFGAAMMNLASPQSATLQQIMQIAQPATLDELRNCVDAARTLTP